MLGTYFDQKLAKWRSFEDGGVRVRERFFFFTQFQGKLMLMNPKHEMGGAVGWGAGGVHVTHPDSLSTPQMRSAT